MAQSKVINMTPGSNSFEICFSQGDVGVTRTMDLIERGGGYFEIPAGSVVKLAGTKPSGLGFNEEVAYSGHTITVTAAEGMTDEAGYIECELKITKEGLKQGSQNGHLAIEKDPHPEGTTDGQADKLVPAITELVERVEEAVEKAEVLQESEAWAVGQRAGEDVGEDDPTFENNAKYYAEHAEGSKTSAGASAQNAAGSASAAAGSAASAAASNTAAQKAKEDAEAAVDAAAAVYTVEGKCTVSVLPNGQVRETWTTEE